MNNIPNSSGIYQIRNTINNKVYIGSAVNLKCRKSRHFNNLRKNKHDNIKLQRAFNKYGEDSFIFEVLEIVEDINMLIKREQHYIDTYCSVSEGYNICPNAGSTLGRPCSEESKIKKSKTLKGRIPWNKGLHYSEEECLRIRTYNGKRKAVICVETQMVFPSTAEAARYYNISSRSHVSGCCRGERPTAGGYHWEYV